MTRRQIVTVNEDGGITVEGMGFQGKSCELPAALLKELGMQTETKRKTEFYQAEQVKQQERR